MPEPAVAPEGEAMKNLETQTAEVIAQCGGAHAAVRELLLSRQLLEDELHAARATNSYGYTRGYHQRRRSEAGWP